MDWRAEPMVVQVPHVTDCDYSFMHTGNELVAGAGRQTIFFDLSYLRQLYLVGKPVGEDEGMINDLN
jgi:hypothetical protein